MQLIPALASAVENLSLIHIYFSIDMKEVKKINGKYSPDIEDVQAVAKLVLRHRIVRNYKAEAEGITEEKIIEGLL